MVSAYRIADRIAMIHHKKMLAAGTVDDIKASTEPYLHEFIRTSGVAAVTDQDVAASLMHSGGRS
jgi:ABC-type transporter Mla maintaining outer membrane lipid asymmetry ATPase subunit MlaF